MAEQPPNEGWYDNPEGEGERYWDGSQWTGQYRDGPDGKGKWWARSFTLPLWALLVGGFVLIGIGTLGGGDGDGAEPAAQEAAETVTVTETVAAEPGEQVTVTETETVEPSPVEAEPPGDQDSYTAGQYELSDVQLSEDFLDDFEARARITNTGSAVSGHHAADRVQGWKCHRDVGWDRSGLWSG